MKIIKLFTADNDKSYFKEIETTVESTRDLGVYSKEYPVTGMHFREFESSLVFDWHNAPQSQYITYLEGKVEVEASGGETRIFQPGEVLLAMDLTGKGHITRTLTKGRSVIVKL